MQNTRQLPLDSRVITGAQVQTREAFLYGRFETMMLPAYGSGIVSSFFTFYDGDNFRDHWNEIDFEFLGRNTNQVDTNVIRTVNAKTDKNGLVEKILVNKRSSDVYWKLCIEWLPSIITWKINDMVVRTLRVNLHQPQKIMMNIWVGNPGWAGALHPAILPQQAVYKYVRFSEFKKDHFVFKWQDDFQDLDPARWYIATHPLETTQLVPGNVSIDNGNLLLKLK